MIKAIWLSIPKAGKTSPSEVSRMKIATTASSWGKICTISKLTSPTRRPVNLMREKL
ncbi:hypothetical protein D3C73_1534970 [compost metagenome]